MKKAVSFMLALTVFFNSFFGFDLRIVHPLLAFPIFRVNEAHAEDIVLDNASSVQTGTWQVSSTLPNYLGSNYLYNSSAAGTDTVTWRPSIATAGNYDVYYWLPDGASGRETAAKYTVVFNGGSKVYSVNQQTVSGGGWKLLGRHAFAVGTAGFVQLKDSNTGSVTIADGIKFVSVPTSIPSTPAGVTAVNDSGSIVLTWQPSSGAAGYKIKYGTSSGNYTVTLDVGTATTKIFTDLAYGTKHYFVIVAYNALGNSLNSSEVSATPNVNVPDIIIDNASVQTSGTWQASATLANYFGSNYLYNSSAAGIDTVTWRPNIPTAGNYDVYYWLPDGASGRETAARYTVVFNGGSKAYSVNQQVVPGGSWKLLGRHAFAVGTTGFIQLKDSNTGSITIADAVKLVFRTPVNLPLIHVKNVRYNASGQVTQLDYGNGVVTTHTYDANLRLKRLLTKNPQGEILQDLNYTFDRVGQILTITDNSTAGTDSQEFKYDALNRLIYAHGEAPAYGTKNYQYDQIGNIISKDGLTYTYGQNGAGPHAVTSLSDGTSFTYDLNGNMISRLKSGVTTQYQYDPENRLKRILNNSTTVADYLYDGDGGRVKKTVQSATPVSTVYVGSMFEKEGSVSRSHVFMGDQRVSTRTNANTLFYHPNHLGSTNVLTDTSAAAKERTEYEPYGQMSRQTQTGATGQQISNYYTGHKLDPESGLYFYGARYYNPALGRFITADTIVQSPYDPQTLNRYSYVSNNPVNRIDPNGHSWKAIKRFFEKWGDFVSPLSRAIITGDWKNFATQMQNIITFVFAPSIWLKIGAGLSYASTATSHIGDNASEEISKGLGYTGKAASAIGTSIEVGKGVDAFLNEKGTFYQINYSDLSQSKVITEAEIISQYGKSGAKVFVNGILTDPLRALEHAANAKADILFYNQTNSGIADLVESTLGFVTGGGALSNRLGKLLVALRLDIVGYSQGTIISSGAMLTAGKLGGAVRGSTLTPFGKAVGMGRLGLLSQYSKVEILYGEGETKFFDVNRSFSSELNPFGYVQGFIGIFTTIGFKQHGSYFQTPR